MAGRHELTETALQSDGPHPSGDRESVSQPSLTPGTRIDQFAIVKLIGRGGMGEVYLARDTQLHRKAALKVVRHGFFESDDARKRFVAEVRTTARFNHPHIVTVYGAGLFHERPYVALEYLDGQDLGERGGEELPSLAEVVHLSLAAAEALNEAHAAGVLHRDLKPENIVVGRDGRVRVVDFGLAKTVSRTRDDDGDVKLTRATRRAGTPVYMSPEQWLEAPLSGATDIWSLGVVIYELCTGSRPFDAETLVQQATLVCGPAEAPRVDSVPRDFAQLIADCLEKDPTRRPSAREVATRLRAQQDVLHKSERRGDKSPFRGLLAFSEDDADLFFGRDHAIGALVERSRHTPVLPIVGPSGTGKSSFVLAGVIPRLREFGSWTVIVMRPGSHPFQTLAGQLLQAERQVGRAPTTSHEDAAVSCRVDETDVLAAQLTAQPQQLSTKLRELAQPHGVRVVLFVDQLEELFTLVDDVETRESFLRAICGAADHPADPVRVVLTMRDDFFGRIAMSSGARGAFDSVTVLQRLERGALAESLTKPLELVGYRFEDEATVEDMVDAVHGEQTGLPLLQFTAQLLWEQRDREAKLLLRSSFQAIGGVTGALASHADGVLETLSAPQQRIARQTLLRLVTSERTRRVTTKDRVLDGLGPQGLVVLDRLIEARLLAVHKETSDASASLELAHESLIACWGTLRRWLDEAREDIAQLEDIDHAAELWERRGRPRDALWLGDALREGVRWSGRATTAIPERVASFLAASQHEQDRQTRTRKRRIVVAIGVLAAIATAAVVVAFTVAEQEREAQQLRADAETREALMKASQADTLLEAAYGALSAQRPLEARAKLRMALEAHDSVPGRSLWWRLTREPLSWQLTLPSTGYGIDFSPNGLTLAVSTQDGLVLIIDAATAQVLKLLPVPDQALDVRFSGDGQRLAAVTWGGEFYLWRVEDGSLVAKSDRHTAALTRIGRSLDGRYFVTSGYRGDIRVWNAEDGTVAMSLGDGASAYATCAIHGDTIAFATRSRGVWLTNWRGGAQPRVLDERSGMRHVEFAPDGRRLLGAGTDGLVYLWAMPSGKLERVLDGHARKPVRRATFNHDGSRVASGGEDGTVNLWDARSGRLVQQIERVDANIDPMRFDPTGQWLAFGTSKGVIKLLSVATTASTDDASGRAVAGHTGPVHGVAFSPDGLRIATSGNDNRVLVWNARLGTVEHALRGHTQLPHKTAFAPDGTTLASASNDRTIRLWNTRDGTEQRLLGGQSSGANTVSFSPDGRLMASGGIDGAVWFHDTTTWARRDAYPIHSNAVTGVRFFPDGDRVVSAGRDGAVRVVDVATGHVVQQFDRPTRVLGVALSPAGTTLAIGTADGATLQPLDGGDARPLGPPVRTLDLDYAPDGESVSLPGADGAIRVVTLADNNVRELSGHDGEVNAVAYDRSGTHLASVADDATVRVWDPATGRALWRAPALLADPPRLLSQRGWQALGGAALPTETALTSFVATHGAHAVQSDDRKWVCVRDFDGEVTIWSVDDDRKASTLAAAQQLIALPNGCAAATPERVTVKLGDQDPFTLDVANTTALGSGEGWLLVAADRQVLTFDLSSRTERRRQTVIAEVAALARIDGRVVVGYESGTIGLLGGQSGAFEQAPGTPATRIVAGPGGSVIVGFGTGAVVWWELHSGRLLGRADLHGAVVHTLMEDDQLYVASELGSYLHWDLGVVSRERCELLRHIWEDVPVTWHTGRPVRTPPPEAHECNAP